MCPPPTALGTRRSIRSPGTTPGPSSSGPAFPQQYVAPSVVSAHANVDPVRQTGEFAERAREAGIEMPDVGDGEQFGKPESEITAAVDVSAYLDHKRRAMRAHASQIGEQSFFLVMPDDAFAMAFGTEWFIEAGAGPGLTDNDLMARS